MSKFLRMTSLVATVAGLAFTATPALAIPAEDDAEARVEILRGLTFDRTQNLALGTVVLRGAGTWSADVSIARDGTFDCDGNSGNVTCSNPHQEARYLVTGSAGYDVDIESGPVTLTNANSDTLTLTPDHDDVVTLDATTGELEFGVGGSVTVDNLTPDGVYTGTFQVTAEYD